MHNHVPVRCKCVEPDLRSKAAAPAPRMAAGPAHGAAMVGALQIESVLACSFRQSYSPSLSRRPIALNSGLLLAVPLLCLMDAHEHLAVSPRAPPAAQHSADVASTVRRAATCSADCSFSNIADVSRNHNQSLAAQPAENVVTTTDPFVTRLIANS